MRVLCFTNLFSDACTNKIVTANCHNLR
jgi:hypothetical protein